MKAAIMSLILVFLLGGVFFPAHADDDFYPICEIQGRGNTSPRVNRPAVTQGIVFADFDNDKGVEGFFIQADCDASIETSDGLFIQLPDALNIVSVGDLVALDGVVRELFGRTTLEVELSGITLLSQGNPLPTPVEFHPPADNVEAKTYFESLESMYVSLSDATVIGPTDERGETWLTRTDLGLMHLFHDHSTGTGQRVMVDEEGDFKLPDATVGDRVINLLGVLNYSIGHYRLHLLNSPTWLPGSMRQTRGLEENALSIATFNVGNLFDTFDDPETEDPIRNAAEYQRHLQKLALTIEHELSLPALIALQEVENDDVLQALVNRIRAVTYEYVWVNSVDSRGIDPALVYDPARVIVHTYEQRQGCTDLFDGLGPDGNQDVTDPQNATTCTTSENKPGNRLFSRPPLVVHVTACQHSCSTMPENLTLHLIIPHFKSKFNDTDEIAYTTPRRIIQAEFVANLVTELREKGAAHIVVLGDLNDTYDSQPLAKLEEAGLQNLVFEIADNTRYSYIYEGVASVLDHIMVSPSLLALPHTYYAVVPSHVNADYPASLASDINTPLRASDHDPVLFTLRSRSVHLYLPVIQR